MTVYFVNGSLQKKKLIESDYAEDMIDIILDFFESHGSIPHMLEIRREQTDLLVVLPNTREHFLITDVGAEDEQIFADWING